MVRVSVVSGIQIYLWGNPDRFVCDGKSGFDWVVCLMDSH